MRKYTERGEVRGFVVGGVRETKEKGESKRDKRCASTKLSKENVSCQKNKEKQKLIEKGKWVFLQGGGNCIPRGSCSGPGHCFTRHGTLEDSTENWSLGITRSLRKRMLTYSLSGANRM